MSKKKPAPDRNQLTMFPELARQTKPDSKIVEPQVWFKELRLLKKLNAVEGSDDFIRKIEFRAGLNVLWAEPEPADSELSISGLYADGFSGHATGKTLFCRILRYLLGDANFATKSDLDGIQSQFIELWAVAEIRLDGRTWIVGRALTGPSQDFAMADATIEEVLHTTSSHGAYNAFIDALEQAAGSVVHNLYPDEGWRHLLPWLTRDQEARFSAINAWRDSLSEADNPRGTSEKQHLLMRTVLSLLDQTEFELREALSHWEEIEKQCAEKIPNKQTIADNDVGALRSTLQNVDNITLELKDLEADLEKISAHIEVRQEAIDNLQKIPESPAVENARKASDLASKAYTRAEDRIKYLKETEIPELKAEQKRKLAFIDQLKNKGIKDPTRVNDNFCPNSIQCARERECVEMPDGESQLEFASLEAEAEELIQRIEGKKTEKASLESKLDQLEAEKTATLNNFNEVRKIENKEANTLGRQVTLLETAKRQIKRAVVSTVEVEELRTKRRHASDEYEKTKSLLVEAKKEVETRCQNFSKVFTDVVGAILGASVTAWVEIQERGLALKANRNGNLGGTALATIKTIAFDLAAVVQSIEGTGRHPRFLIHDGPREGDMARIVYGRLFLLARHIEEAFKGQPPNFQYIVTTTTPPPSDMQEGSEWLLCEPMKGSDKRLKLLRTDF